MSSYSESNSDDPVSRWIDSDTGNHIFTRCTAENLEARTVAAAELFNARYYKSIAAASRAFKLPYKRLRSRIQGHNSVQCNGGLNTRLDAAQMKAVIIWAHRQVLSGFHIRGRRLRQHVNAILKASGSQETVGKRWCQRFMKRYRNIFHLRKAMTRDAKRKGVQKRAILSSWFNGFSRYLRLNHIKKENVYNFDETGFMIGYLQTGIFVWTFLDIQQPVLTDSNDKVLITSIDCISAAGAAIPPFIVAPGVQIPVRWVQNDLEDDTVISTSAKGYITDMIALEWIRHFDKHTKPSDPNEPRVLLMDNHECHHTEEFISYCYANNITLFPLPPNSTHYLQPLDVGVFGPFKHWHQEVLYRSIAEGAFNFNKTDFFFHLQEIRNRTFKRSTILSAWARSGLFPFNPAVVLDTIQDPLSSLTPIVDKTTLPGYIESGIEKYDNPDYSSSDESSASDDSSSSLLNLQRSNSRPSTLQRAVVTAAVATPQKSPVINWNSAPTPSLNIPIIERYHQYVELRMQVSISSRTPLTPSVLRTYEKARKTGRALEINGVTASHELRQQKEKLLARQKLQDETRVVARFGPISVGDARARVATDDYNRRAAQEDEARRVKKRAIRSEEEFLRRWLRIVRGLVRAGITSIQREDLKVLGPDDTGYLTDILVPQPWFLKQDKRAFLNSLKSMSQIYAMHRQLHESIAFEDRQLLGSFVWPMEYTESDVTAAIEQLIQSESNRKMKKNLLSQETDGISIISIKESESEAPLLDEIFVETQYEEIEYAVAGVATAQSASRLVGLDHVEG